MDQAQKSKLVPKEQLLPCAHHIGLAPHRRQVPSLLCNGPSLLAATVAGPRDGHQSVSSQGGFTAWRWSQSQKRPWICGRRLESLGPRSTGAQKHRALHVRVTEKALLSLPVLRGAGKGAACPVRDCDPCPRTRAASASSSPRLQQRQAELLPTARRSGQYNMWMEKWTFSRNPRRAGAAL